ncbi:MAG: hypothetical protein NTY12_02715 [Candidatus Falkowbacteria bacterium]|nr:hypothetical protein [Candidatus Falkowbacteria bacterium]
MSNKLVSSIIGKINSIRRKEFEKKLPEGQTLEFEKARIIEELKKYLFFLEEYIKNILSKKDEIEAKIKQIKAETNQSLNEEQLIKELWILRYTCLHLWFFGIKPPKNQNDIDENVSLINHAFQSIEEVSNFLPWLKKGFTEYTSIDELRFSDLEELESKISEKISGKIPLIAFECTGGRLGGELHDFVIELLMTTITQDKGIFETGHGDITGEETENIKKVIGDMSTNRTKLAEDFFDELIN